MVLRECTTSFNVEYVYDKEQEAVNYIYNKFITRTLYDNSSLDYHAITTNDTVLVVYNDCIHGNSLEVTLVKIAALTRHLTVRLKRGFVLNEYILKDILQNQLSLNTYYTRQAIDQVIINHQVFIDFTLIKDNYE